LAVEEINVWGLQKSPEISKNRSATGPKYVKVEVTRYGRDYTIFNKAEKDSNILDEWNVSCIEYSKCHVTSNKAKSNLECAEEKFQTRGWVRGCEK
jgi:hypothetical protein